MIFGNKIPQSPPFRAPAGVADVPTLTSAGNVALPIGHVINDATDWTKSEHVVLTPDEARDYALRILALLPVDRREPKAETMGELSVVELIEGINRECAGMSARLTEPDPNPAINAQLLRAYLGSIWGRVHNLRMKVIGP